MGFATRHRCARAVVSLRRRSQIRRWHNAGLPNQARDPRAGSQLGGWACPAWPLRVFSMTQDPAFELPVEVLLRGEDVIDDARQLERDQGAGDADRLLAGLGFEEGADLRVVLDGADAGVTERELEVAVARLGARAMPRAASRIVGPGDQAAVGEELPGRWEPDDAVDLGVDGEGVHLAEARDPE